MFVIMLTLQSTTFTESSLPPSPTSRRARSTLASAKIASEIIKSQEEAYAARRADEEKRWEEQEKKRSDSEDQSSKRLEALASTVLDAAEVANRSASAVTNSHRSLTIGAKTLTNAAANGNLKSTIVVSLAVALLIATAGLFSLVMYQMSKKMDQLDLMIVALGTRSAEMKNSLGSIEDLTKNITSINKNFDQLKKVNSTLSASIETLNSGAKKEKEEQLKLLSAQTKKLNEESLRTVEKMMTSIKGLEKSFDSKIKAQGTTINKQIKATRDMANELKKFENKIQYYLIDKFPDNLSNWGRENFQRNFHTNAIQNLNDDDYIMISDLDEIPNMRNIKDIDKFKYTVFEQLNFS